MHRESSKLLTVLLLGFGCLLLALFGLFLWTNPVLASVMATVNPTEPTQEILWAPMQLKKPTVVALQSNTATSQIHSSLDGVPSNTAATIQPENESPSATETPGTLVMEIVGDTFAETNDEGQEQYSPAADERWIEVDLSEQRTHAYEGDVLVNSFVVSTGLPETPTITGEYSIYIKVPIQDMSGPGYYLPNVPWVMYFYDEYGFHGTYWHNNFGTPMSRGCVNLTIDDAKWLYDWASVGTRVIVHQ